MSSPRKVSEPTVRRLSTYYRTLEDLAASGQETVSSGRLADAGGLTSAQVRKDLSVFGSFGVRGRGYPVLHLRDALKGILGVDQDRPAVVVGAGRLGTALASYPNFSARGFHIVALFDVDPARVGEHVGDAEILPADTISDWVRRHGVCLAILATPAEAAQEAANRLVAGGIGGILNFTATTPEVPESVNVRSVNLSIELEGLCYAIRESGLWESDREGGAS